MKCGVPICKFSSDDPTKVSEHLKTEHKRENLFSCKKCCRYFTIPSNLIQHMHTECFKKKESTEPRPPSPSSKPLETSRGQSKLHGRELRSRTIPVKSVHEPAKTTLKKPSRTKNPFKPFSKTRTCNTGESKLTKVKRQAKHPKKDAERKEPTKKRGRKKKIVETSSQQTISLKKTKCYEHWSDWWIAVTCSKSSVAIKQLLREESLRNFYMCMDYSCHFHTNDNTDFVKHQIEEHASMKLPCRYCFVQFEAGVSLVEHTISVHSTLTKQCSRCLYRAATITQVSLHFDAIHGGEPVIYCCESVRQGESNVAENTEDAVAASSSCLSAQDNYEVDGAELVSHMVHKYQCAYCNNSADTISKILLHQCLNHPERPLQLNILPSSYSNESHLQGNETSGLKGETETRGFKVETETSGLKGETETRGLKGETETNASIPDYHPNATNFSCGLETCLFVLDGIKSYEKHLLGYHHSNSFFPCPHCTEIHTTSSSLGEHILMHGKNMYSCSKPGCFSHWEKYVVVAHCRDKHQHGSANVVTVRELIGDEMPNKEVERVLAKKQEIKKELDAFVDKMPEPIPAHSNQDNSRLKFPLQLSSHFHPGVHSTLSFEKRKCTCGEISEEKVVGCLACSKQFQSQDILEQNAENTGISGKYINIFKEHIYNEIGYSPFYCDVCEFKAVSRDRMVHHMKAMHPNALESSCKELRNETLESWISMYIDAGSANSYLSEGNNNSTNILKSSTTFDVPMPSTESYNHYQSDHMQSHSHTCLSSGEGSLSMEVSHANASEDHTTEENLATNIRIVSVEGRIEQPSNPPTIDLESEQKQNCISNNNGRQMELDKTPQFAKPHQKPCPASKRCLPSTFQKASKSSNLIKQEQDDDVQVVLSEYEDIKVVFSNMNDHNSIRAEEESEYFSFYGKKSAELELSNVCVVSPHASGLRIKIPVEDLMKFTNFNARLRIPDLSKAFFNGF